jgi:putative drug exporter of the RND superfamily
VTTEPARTGSSSAGRRWAHRIAGLPSGRRTKYAVLAFWVIVIALTGSLAGKLMGVEKNDASAYLPASAESTQALKLQDRFTPPNLNPAVVVYVRPSGLTPADLAKITSDAGKFATLNHAATSSARSRPATTGPPR